MAEDTTVDPEGHEAPEGSGDGKDDKTVPLSALEAERDKRQALELRLAKLEGAVSTQKQTAAAPKPVTRAQLRAAVAEGKISQDESDDLWDQQVQAKAAAKATSAAQATGHADRITRQLDQYVELEPDIARADSRLRARITKEFKFLVGELGDPDDATTELKAIRAVLGSLDAVKTAKKGKDVSPETHQESSGGSSGATPGPPSKLKLSPDMRSYYQQRIDAGAIKDWKAVEAKLAKYASPRVKQRVGLAA